MTNIIANISADVEDGGWEASGVIWNDADAIDFEQQVTSWYDLYAGAWSDAQRPAFAGHLSPETWTKTIQTSEAPWKAYTAHEMMKDGQLQGIYFKDDATPENRHQIIDMTFAKIFYEIVGGHCNLLLPSFGTAYDADLWGTLFTTPTHEDGFMGLNIDFTNSAAVASYEVKDGSFWSKLKEIANKEFYVVYTDKNNVLNYVPHPMFNATTPATVIDIDSGLLLEPLTITRRNTTNIGQMILHGTDPSGSAITGTYPTDPAQGPIQRRGGYVVDSGSALTNIAQRAYLFETRGYTVEAEIGNGVGLLLELLDRVTVTYTSSADGIAWSDEAFYVHKIEVSLMDNFTARTRLTLEQENTA